MEKDTIRESSTTTTTTTSTLGSNATSPISAGKKNWFVGWLNDSEIAKDTDTKVTTASAVASYAKGLIEIVKTIYKKPFLSTIAVASGTILAVNYTLTAFTPVMSITTGAGVAGMVYGIYSLIKSKSGETSKQAYEILGVSTFVLAIGLYGLLA